LSFGIGTTIYDLIPNVNSFFNASLSIKPPWNENSLDEDLQFEVEFRTKHNEYFYKGIVLENMTGLDLSCNNLTGYIPSQIGDLQQIKALNLSHNFLSGPIPITFSNLTQWRKGNHGRHDNILLEFHSILYNNTIGLHNSVVH